MENKYVCLEPEIIANRNSYYVKTSLSVSLFLTCVHTQYEQICEDVFRRCECMACAGVTRMGTMQSAAVSEQWLRPDLRHCVIS
jgi:hypothetical protein